MKKIGIISDTHGFIDDKLKDFFKEVDTIFHAGDIGDTNIISELREITKLVAVYGNIDNTMIRQITSEFKSYTIEEVKIIMTHIGGYPGRYQSSLYNMILKEKPNLVITGHSHILKVLYDKKLTHLHINPGAYGRSGFHKVRTAIRLTIDGNKMKNLEIIELKRN